MWVIKYRNLFFFLSALVVGVSLFAIFTYGLNLGIEFKGGSILEADYSGVRPDLDSLRSDLNQSSFKGAVLQPLGEKGVSIRLHSITDDEKNQLLSLLSGNDSSIRLTEKRFSSIGPSIGQELANKGLVAIAIVVVMIILFVTLAFWGVSRPIPSWKYGVIVIVALLHDLIIPTGVFAVLGHFRNVEVDALFLTALLTILGLSVNDTIVVFDRIRENLKNKIAPHFEDTVGISLSQTFQRSINTSLTVILALLALLFFGGESTYYFALTLTIGMLVGTYSSIFIASPLLVVWEKFSRK